MVYVNDFNKTFQLLQRRIPNKIHIQSKIDPRSTSRVEKVLLLSEINDMNEAAAFIEAYEDVTHSSFNIIFNKKAPNSLSCKRKWICNHDVVSGLNKTCPASISISIKPFDDQSMLQDDVFLRSSFPRRCVIKIKPSHNHSVVIPLSPYKLLKVNNDVKMCFYEYFKRGHFGSRAKLLHEQYLQRANFFILTDESMNPSLQAIYTLGKNWLKMKENMEINKATDNVSWGLLPATDIADVVSKLKKEPDDDYNITENTANGNVEDIKPVLTIKQEIIDEDERDGLPVISSYGSLVTPIPSNIPSQPIVKSSTVKKTVKKSAKKTSQSVPSVVKVVQQTPSQVVIYKQLSSKHKVVKCLSLNADNYSTCQYKTYLHSALMPMRLSH